MTKFGDRFAADPAPGAGSVILTGDRPPLHSEGNLGDFWFDTGNRILYGPKALGEEHVNPGSIPATDNSVFSGSAGQSFTVKIACEIVGMRSWRPSSASSNRPHKICSGGVELARKTSSGDIAGAWNITYFDDPISIAANTQIEATVYTTYFGYTSGALSSRMPDYISHDGRAYASGDTCPAPSAVQYNYFADIIVRVPLWPVGLVSA